MSIRHILTFILIFKVPEHVLQEKLHHAGRFELDHHGAERGRQQLADFESRHPSRHSSCWLKSVEKLKSGCSKMGDMEQSILALQFANCHLEKSGLNTYHCYNKETFKDCTRQMGTKDNVAFQTYTEFYTHVTDICYYLQSEIWREKTENTIGLLSKTSQDTAEKLTKSLDKQEEVLSKQGQSLANQQKMLENEKRLQITLKASADNASQAFADMQKQAHQQKAIFTETFDGIFKGVERLSKLQSMLLGEFMSLHSIAFYFVAVVALYFLTSTPRTCDARLFLYLSLTALIMIEKLAIKSLLKKQQTGETSTEEIHSVLWLLRKIYLALATLILTYFAARYKDYNMINYKILADIQCQINELRRLQNNTAKHPALHSVIKEVGQITSLEVVSPISSVVPNFHNNNVQVKSPILSSTPQKVTGNLHKAPRKCSSSSAHDKSRLSSDSDSDDVDYLPGQSFNSCSDSEFSDEDENHFENTRLSERSSTTSRDRSQRKNKKDQGSTKKATKNESSQTTNRTQISPQMDSSRYDLRPRQNRTFTSPGNNDNSLRARISRQGIRITEVLLSKKRNSPARNTSRAKKGKAFFSSDEDE